MTEAQMSLGERMHTLIRYLPSHSTSFKYKDLNYTIVESLNIGNYTINIYQCSSCLKLFSTKKDILNHKCHPYQGKEEFVFNEAKTTKYLLELIAINNYSFSSIDTPAFRKFVNSFGRNYNIPSADTISRLMINYAKVIHEKKP